MTKKTLFKIVVATGLIGFTLSGCAKNSAPDYSGDPKYEIYELYLQSGGTLTYQEWLDSIRGEDGADGQNGQDGAPGQDGKDGKDGSSLRSGNGVPSNSLGQDGDSYINLDNWDYYLKVNGLWVKSGNIKGAQGSSGLNGVSVVSIIKTGTEGLVDTYTITYSDNTTSTFTVTNGQDGASIKGDPGADGHTPVITISNDGYWVVDGIKTSMIAKGDKGDPGEDGRGIDYIEIVDDHLIVHYTDNTYVDAGSIIPSTSTYPFVFMDRGDGTYTVKASEAAKDYVTLTIPGEYNELPVSAIAAEGFKGISSLETLVISENVQVIGADAFRDCIGLSSVSFPETLTTIGHSSFRGCVTLTSITIPANVNLIGAYAFYESSLGSATFLNTTSSWRTRTLTNNGATAPYGASSTITSLASSIQTRSYLKCLDISYTTPEYSSTYYYYKYDLISSSSLAAQAFTAKLSFSVSYKTSSTGSYNNATITATFYFNDWYY